MALTTQGSSLSTLSRAPRIPESVGQLDVKAIYDGVRQGLAAFENVRRAPASMALADADTRAKTLEAPMGTVLAEEAAKQAPLRTQILAVDANSAEAMKNAQIAGLTAKAAPKAPSGDIQLANALAGAQLRLAEDPNDAQAAQLISVLGPIALKKSAVSAANPQGVIDAGVQKTADTIAAGAANTAANNAARLAQTKAKIEADTTLSAEERALKLRLAEMGIQSRHEISRETNAARIEQARASSLGRSANKAYDEALKQNAKVQEELVALDQLEEAGKAFIASKIGSGVVAGSAPMIFARSFFFGDDTGKNFQAAISQSMRSAVETMRGLGAMSEKEFNAAMDQLPSPDEPDSAILAKLEYMKHVRTWVAARNNLYLDELSKGSSQMQAGDAVRRALPMPVMGKVDDDAPASVTRTPAPAPAQAGSAAQASAPATSVAPPTVTTKAQYDALPPNAPYMDAQGVLRRKVGNG